MTINYDRDYFSMYFDCFDTGYSYIDPLINDQFTPIFDQWKVRGFLSVYIDFIDAVSQIVERNLFLEMGGNLDSELL